MAVGTAPSLRERDRIYYGEGKPYEDGYIQIYHEGETIQNTKSQQVIGEGEVGIRYAMIPSVQYALDFYVRGGDAPTRKLPKRKISKGDMIRDWIKTANVPATKSLPRFIPRLRDEWGNFLRTRGEHFAKLDAGFASYVKSSNETVEEALASDRKLVSLGSLMNESFFVIGENDWSRLSSMCEESGVSVSENINLFYYARMGLISSLDDYHTVKPSLAVIRPPEFD